MVASTRAGSPQSSMATVTVPITSCLRGEQPTDVVGTTARLHRDRAWRKLRREVGDRRRLHPALHDNGTALVHACQAAAVLAEVNSDRHNGHSSLLLISTGMLRDAGELGRAIP